MYEDSIVLSVAVYANTFEEYIHVYGYSITHIVYLSIHKHSGVARGVHVGS